MIVDLIDVQGSSVMVCLEDGWDFATQVIMSKVSLVQESLNGLFVQAKFNANAMLQKFVLFVFFAIIKEKENFKRKTYFGRCCTRRNPHVYCVQTRKSSDERTTLASKPMGTGTHTSRIGAISGKTKMDFGPTKF